MSAGAELKRWREAAKLSQQRLATALSISLPIVSRWERNVNVPRRDMAKRIDDQLSAGGAILAAFGYLSPPGDDPLTALRAEMAALTAEVRTLQRDVGLLAGVAGQRSRRARPAGPQSPGGSQ